jgi:hypothetical protein
LLGSITSIKAKYLNWHYYWESRAKSKRVMQILSRALYMESRAMLAKAPPSWHLTAWVKRSFSSEERRPFQILGLQQVSDSIPLSGA